MIESQLYQGGQEASETTQQQILEKIATEASLADLKALLDALNSNGTDLLRVRHQGTVSVQENTPLDVSGATVPTEQQTPVGIENSAGAQIDPLSAGDQPLDVSGAVVTVAQQAAVDVGTLPDTDEAFASGAALAGNGETAVGSLTGSGAEALIGQVVSTGAYDVRLDWNDSAGTTIRSETLVTGVAGGTWTDLNENAKSPYVDVVVVDGSGASQTIDGTAHLA